MGGIHRMFNAFCNARVWQLGYILQNGKQQYSVVCRNHKAGKKLLVIWDYQLQNRDFIISKVKAALNHPDYNFKLTTIKVVDSDLAAELLNQHHYKKRGNRGYAIGAFDGDNLIAVVIFIPV